MLVNDLDAWMGLVMMLSAVLLLGSVLDWFGKLLARRGSCRRLACAMHEHGVAKDTRFVILAKGGFTSDAINAAEDALANKQKMGGTAREN